VLPSLSGGRLTSEHSDGLGAFRVRPVVSQSRVATAVVTPCCFVLSLVLPSSASVGSVRSLGPPLGAPFGLCAPLRLLWPLLTPQPLSGPGSPRVRVCSVHSRLWALQSVVSDSWAWPRHPASLPNCVPSVERLPPALSRLPLAETTWRFGYGWRHKPRSGTFHPARPDPCRRSGQKEPPALFREPLDDARLRGSSPAMN